MNPLLRRWISLCFVAVIGVTLFLHLTDLHPVNLLPSGLVIQDVEKMKLKPIVWKDIPEHYPVQSIKSLPVQTGAPVAIPTIQATFKRESASHIVERMQRRDAVREAFEHSWNGYIKHAWMHDEVAPVSGAYNDHFGGWGASLVDSLDSLYIMGFQKEFEDAVAVLKKIDFTTTPLDTLNVFETTIRYLGGFLGAHDVSGGEYPILMEKALQIGEMLYMAFDTPNRMPITRWNWRLAAEGAQQEAQSHSLSAELGSLTVEFTRLSQLSGDSKYYDAVQRITDVLEAQQNKTHIPGLWPIVLDAASMTFTKDLTFTFGGMSDSLYEYLPKEYLLLGGLVPQYWSMYESVIDTAKKYLFFRPLTPQNQDILLSGTARKRITPNDIKLDPESQQYVRSGFESRTAQFPSCYSKISVKVKISSRWYVDETEYLGTAGLEVAACVESLFWRGMIAIASKIFDRRTDIVLARKLVDGCIWAYNTTATGIMPELFRTVPCPDVNECQWDKSAWYYGVNAQQPSLDSSIAPENPDDRAEQLILQERLPFGFTEVRDRRYILRPEAIESIFIMYRITGDQKYQEDAWQMFNAITRNSKTNIGYAAISDVTVQNPKKMDSSESFWMAETLKYFYLIFSEPDLISLDEYVLNTEAHPLRRPKG